MRVVVVCLTVLAAMSLPSAARAQTIDPTPPAPAAPTFISRSVWLASFSALSSGDPRFAWIARVRADVDIFDYQRGRINFWGQYEGVLGRERRLLDLNHENFVVEGSASYRIRASEVSGVFHHTSRHLSDRPFDGVVAWNTATFRAAHQISSGATRYWGHAEISKVLQHSNVDYAWTGTIEFDVDHRFNPRASLVGMGTGSLFGIQNEPNSRNRQCGARGELGIVIHGDKGGMEFYVAYETRSDAYPSSHQHAHWAEVGFKLIGSS